MPEIYYGGTVTFNSNYSLEKKNKLIMDFQDMLSQHLSHKAGRTYNIKVSKEYHKVEGENDPEAPHLHFILIADRLLANYRVRAISEFLKDKCGRSQFYRMTTMKYNSYSKYILKDVESNNEEFKQSHYYEGVLSPPIRDIDLEDNFEDDYD